METVLNIGGMSCAHCVKHVTEALEDLKGVKSAKVSLKKNIAVVKYEGDVTLEDMKAAVEEAGYEVLA